MADRADAVLAEHEHAQRRHAAEVARERLDAVVVQVEEDEVGQVVEVADLLDVVVLVVEQPHALLRLEDRAHREVAPVEVEPLGVRRALLRRAVHDERVGLRLVLREEDAVGRRLVHPVDAL